MISSYCFFGFIQNSPFQKSVPSKSYMLCFEVFSCDLRCSEKLVLQFSEEINHGKQINDVTKFYLQLSIRLVSVACLERILHEVLKKTCSSNSCVIVRILFD